MKTQTLKFAIAGLIGALALGIVLINQMPTASAPVSDILDMEPSCRAGGEASTKSLSRRIAPVPAGDPAIVQVELTPEAQAMANLRERLLAESVELVRIEVPVSLDEEVEISLSPVERLVLKKHSVRSKNFRVVTQNEDGTFNELPVGPVRTYMGEIEDDPDAMVGASLLPGGLSARIIHSHESERGVAPLSGDEAVLLGRNVSGQGTLHAVYTPRPVSSEELGCPGGCADHHPEPAEDVEIAALNEDGSMTPSAGAALEVLTETSIVPDVTVKQAELGFDVAYSFYSVRCGSDTNITIQTLEDFVNNDLNLVFIRDALIEHVIGTVVIRTTAATDPYDGMGSGYDTLPLLRTIWNGDHGTYPAPSTTHDIGNLALSQPQGVTGLAYVGVVGTASRYAITTANSGMGYWRSGNRHEIGHNWSLSHGDGAGEPTHWGDSFGLMVSGFHERANSVEASKMIQHRNSRSPGVLDDIGAFPTGIAPYCFKDVGLVAQSGGPAVVLDVLANDHDANNDSFVIEWIKVDTSGGTVNQTTPSLVTTDLGGTLIRSIGTGPNGRDTLIYTPPAFSEGGADDFHIGIRDSSGSGQWGYCSVTLGETPPGPFGEIAKSGIITDTLYDWSSEAQPQYGWEYGRYSGSTFFSNPSATNSASEWIGGNAAVWSVNAAEPEVGEYSMNPKYNVPAVRRWNSTYAGRIAIEYDARRLERGGFGLDISIRHNGTVLMAHTLNHNNETSISDPNALIHAGTVFAEVVEGDTIDFVVAAKSTLGFDWAQFHSRILKAGSARGDDGLLLRFPLDTGNEMSTGGSSALYDTRNWAADMSGNNHHMRFYNHDPLFAWKPGVVGNAFGADGSSSYGKSVEQNIGEGATELTLSAWVKPASKGDNEGIISAKSPGSDYCSLLVSSYGGGNPGEFRCRNNRVTGPTNSVPVGRWTHVAGVWKSGEFQILYLNGREVERAATPPGGYIVDIENWHIGSDREIVNRYFDGLIDDATVWERALSPTEIQALYEETRPSNYYNGEEDIYVIENPLVGEDFTEITVATWLRPHSKSGSVQGILTTATNSPSESYFGLIITGYGVGNPVEFRASSKFIFGPTNSAPVNVWLHAVGVWKAGELQKLYIDGALAGEVPQNEVPSAPANLGAWVVGRDREAWSDRYFDGDISEPLIVERALSDDEVFALYQQEQTRFNSGQTHLLGSEPIGLPAIDAELFEASGIYTLTASGAGISGTSDSMQFSELNRSGGMTDINVKLEALSASMSNAVAGIMLRESMDSDAPYIMLARREDGQLGLMQRTAAGAAIMPVEWQPGPAGGLWLRLLRSGDGIAARYSVDGESWTDFNFITSDLSSDALVGLGLSSGSQVQTMTAAVSGMSAGDLPAGETDIDGDGLGDAWEMDEFESLGVTDGGVDEDWDIDGSSDLDEFMAGTDPRDPNSWLGFTTVPEVLANGNVQVSWSAVAGKSYKIVAKEELAAETWTDVLIGIPAVVPVTTREVTPPFGTASQFYKVVVENPTAP